MLAFALRMPCVEWWRRILVLLRQVLEAFGGLGVEIELVHGV